MKERDILRFEGPQGTFYLREDSDKPIILLASGTGFAPIKALVEQLIHTKSERPVALYWGGRRPADLYMDKLCQEWAANARLPLCTGDFRCTSRRSVARSHRLRSSGGDGRSSLIYPAIRCMPAVHR
jgi:NAD(P)H-flavin reductase